MDCVIFLTLEPSIQPTNPPAQGLVHHLVEFKKLKFASDDDNVNNSKKISKTRKVAFH